MSLLYQNLLRTYMSVAKDIFGNNQVQNPSVQDAMYEAVNTHKFSTSHFDDVPLARKYYEQLRQKKLRESRNKEYSKSTARMEVGNKMSTDDDLSIDEKRRKELMNKFRQYKSMNRDLIMKKKERYIHSIEKEYEERKNNSIEVKKDTNNKNKYNNEYKVNNIYTQKNLDKDNNIYTYNKVEIKSSTKPVDYKYNIKTSNYNSNNYSKGQKVIETKEYTTTIQNSQYSNTNIPSRKNKSENKNISVSSINTTKYTTSQNQQQKITNKPTTSANISVKSYGQIPNNNNTSNETYKSIYKKEINTQENKSVIISPNYTTYKKTEITSYKKEEAKPYIKNISTTKYEATKNPGNNNVITSNVSVVTSSYQNSGNYKNTSNKIGDNNKMNLSQNSKTVTQYQTKYVNTGGNFGDKRNENNFVTKIERKIEIKNTGSSNKDSQVNKQIKITKSYKS